MTRTLVTLMLLAPSIAWGEPGVVTVIVSGVRSNAGHVLVAVCDKATFLEPTCRYTGRAPASNGAVTIRIEGVPPGIYAAQAFQDENDNGKIDRSLLGFPREGLGFSNDAKISFGPPSFDDAAFSLGPSGASIRFALRYFD